MRFEWSQFLWLFVPAAWWLWRRYRRPTAAVEFSSLELIAPGAVSWRTRWAWLPDALRALAVVLVIFSLARPQWAMEREERTREGIAIELLVDISSSMDMSIPSTENEKITRMAGAKSVLEQFIAGDGKELPGRGDDLLGLVTFARYADTVSPLTEAHDALVEIVRNLTIQDRPNEDGTAYGDAVTLASAHLHQLETSGNRDDPGAGVKNRVIVLLTDGENNCGRHLPLEATALAKQWGIRIYAISLSDPNPLGGASSVSSTAPATSEQILMRMAAETGGIYQRADDVHSLQSVYQKIDSLEKSRISIRNHTAWRDLFPEITAMAFLLIVADVMLRTTYLRRIP